MKYRTIKMPATLGTVTVKKVENTAYKIIIKDKPILRQTLIRDRGVRKTTLQHRKEEEKSHYGKRSLP